MNNTISFQGRFTSTGGTVSISFVGNIDWMYVYNITQAAANQTTAVGVAYKWFRGFPAGAKWTTFKSNAAAAANLEQYLTTGGFTLYDDTVRIPGALTSTITAISNAAIPVVTNSGTNGLAAGSVVRLFNIVGGQQLGGMDFTVGYNTLSATTFSLDYMAQIVAATTGSWRVIPFDPIFYPARRFITKITNATQAVVTLSVTHGYQVGQTIRMIVPEKFGMTQMNGLLGTIVAVNTTLASGNTITLDIDSTAFSAFAFPLTAQSPMTYAETVPVGENTAAALAFNVNILSDATLNDATQGIILTGGVNNPAGAANDVIYYIAGRSFNVVND